MRIFTHLHNRHITVYPSTLSWSELMEVSSDIPVKPEEPHVTVEEENQNRWVAYTSQCLQKDTGPSLGSVAGLSVKWQLIKFVLQLFPFHSGQITLIWPFISWKGYNWHSSLTGFCFSSSWLVEIKDLDGHGGLHLFSGATLWHELNSGMLCVNASY